MIHRIVVGPIATNCWIIQYEKAGIIIDPGFDPDTIIARLEYLHIQPEYILLTHGHFDHVLAIGAINLYYEQKGKTLQIAIHTLDQQYLGKNALNAHRKELTEIGGLPLLEKFNITTLPPPTRLLQEDDRIGPFIVLHLPGHTPGSVGYYDEATKQIFSGDTLFANGVGRTDLPGSDDQALKQSLRRLLALPGDVTVYPGHGPRSTIDACRKFIGTI
jgi:glyoxylase-like metal-dependent hydrolase (beta-lactamase superfamily II)